MKIQHTLAILLALALLLCLLPATALAEDPDEPVETGAPAEGDEPEEPEDPDTPEEPEPSEEPEEPAQPAPAGAAGDKEEEDEEEEEDPAPVINGEDQVCYPMEGETVYNNGGTVYNNGALVYNNGGLVYQNSGTVYNNGGVVYANAGLVYNNGGTVYRNDATVYTFDDDVQQSRIYGAFHVTTAEDYSAIAEIEGLDENDMLLEGQSCTIRVPEGLSLRSVEADAGTLTENEDGSWTLEDLDADATLTLEAQAEAPVFDLAEGCYAEAQTLSITGPEGAELYYSLDGSDPDEDSLLYEEPIQLTEGCTVCAAALLPSAEPSEITRAEYAFVTITAPELPDGTQGEEPPEAAAFTVENTGKIPAVIESVSLSGKSASYFSLSTEEGGTVKAGKSDSKTWTLQPAADLTRGNYKAIVIFTLAGGQTVQFEVRYKVK